MYIHTIATHSAPHPEEYFARWLLKTKGEDLFPGVSTATFICYDSGNTPDGRNGDELEAEGVLCLGIGGGRFDEHPRADVDRIKGECVATLVAKALGLDQDPAYASMIDAIKKNDLEGIGNDLLQIGGMVQAMNRCYPLEDVAYWIDLVFDAFYEKQHAYLEALKEFEEKARIEEIMSWRGPLRLAVIQSDLDFISSVANGRAANVDIAVVQKSTGNVQIYTNKRSGVRLADLVRMVRIEEQLEKDALVTTNYDMLEAEGAVAGAEEWYFVTSTADARRPDLLLNGSRSAPNVQPTRLALEDIVALLKAAVDPNQFEQDHVRDCERGLCTDSRANPCYWKRWGLQRCRKIRYDMLPDSQKLVPASNLARR